MWEKEILSRNNVQENKHFDFQKGEEEMEIHKKTYK